MLLLPSSWSLFVFRALAYVLMSLNTLPSSTVNPNSSQNKGLPWVSGHFLTSPLSAQYPMLLPTVPKPHTKTALREAGAVAAAEIACDASVPSRVSSGLPQPCGLPSHLPRPCPWPAQHYCSHGMPRVL